jgi:uncharacterized phage protein (TIGR02216 family)
MGFGFTRLRLSSEAFWSLTVPELLAAAEALTVKRPKAPSTQDLASLLSRFPDRTP